MIAVLASIRPDSWNFPLLLHIAGAAVFFGALTVGTVAQLTATKVAQPEFLQRVAFRTLLIVGLPAYIVFRVGAQWIYDKEFGDSSDDPTWIGIGFMVSDIGAIVFLVALVLAGIASRKSKFGLGKASGVLSALILVGLVIAVWAMGAKPD
jgi:hypothetical protein